MRKTKQLFLTYPHWPIGSKETSAMYRVSKVADTTEFSPDQFLSRKNVDELCDASDWKIHITSPRK